MSKKEIEPNITEAADRLGIKDVKGTARAYLGEAPYDCWIEKGKEEQEDVIVISTNLKSEVTLGKGTELVKRIIQERKPSRVEYDMGRGDDWGSNGLISMLPDEANGRIKISLSCYIYDHAGGIFPFNDPGKHGYKQVVTSTVSYGGGYFEKVEDISNSK